MKVCLINPFTTAPPFGIMSIASVLEKKGIDVKLVAYNHPDIPKEKILNDVKDCDMIGISVYTMPMINEAVRITTILKRNTNAFLFWGGVHPTLFPEKSLREFGLDCVVLN